MTAGDDLYGRAHAVQEHTPVYRWLARQRARPWPASLRMVSLGETWAAVLPIYAADGALVGSWQLEVTEDGEPTVAQVCGPVDGSAAVRLMPQPARHMALVADIPEALRQWARLSGPIWCPITPHHLHTVALPPEAEAVAVAWAFPGGPSEQLHAARVRDLIRREGRQAIAVPPGGVEMLLAGPPADPADPPPERPDSAHDLLG